MAKSYAKMINKCHDKISGELLDSRDYVKDVNKRDGQTVLAIADWALWHLDKHKKMETRLHDRGGGWGTVRMEQRFATEKLHELLFEEAIND